MCRSVTQYSFVVAFNICNFCLQNVPTRFSRDAVIYIEQVILCINEARDAANVVHLNYSRCFRKYMLSDKYVEKLKQHIVVLC